MSYRTAGCYTCNTRAYCIPAKSVPFSLRLRRVRSPGHTPNTTVVQHRKHSTADPFLSPYRLVDRLELIADCDVRLCGISLRDLESQEEFPGGTGIRDGLRPNKDGVLQGLVLALATLESRNQHCMTPSVRNVASRLRILTSVDRTVRDFEACRGVASDDRQKVFVSDLDSSDVELEGRGSVARHNGSSEVRVADSQLRVRTCVVRAEDDFRVELELKLRLTGKLCSSLSDLLSLTPGSDCSVALSNSNAPNSAPKVSVPKSFWAEVSHGLYPVEFILTYACVHSGLQTRILSAVESLNGRRDSLTLKNSAGTR
jgi:hypothetical protein